MPLLVRFQDLKKDLYYQIINITGPYNPLHEQLDENDNPLPGQEPFNQVDEISRQHDICYRDHSNDKTNCDKVMLNKLSQMTSNTRR